MSVASYWGEGKHERLSPLEPNYSFKRPIDLVMEVTILPTISSGMLTE